MKYFQTFNSITEYNEAIANNEIEYPNVSIIKGLNRSYFNNNEKIENIVLETEFETYYDSAGTLNNIAITNGCGIKELIIDGQKIDVEYNPIIRTTYSVAGDRAIINEDTGEIESAYKADTSLYAAKLSAFTKTIDFDFSEENETERQFENMMFASYLSDVEIYPKHGTLKSNNVQGIIAIMDKVILEDLVDSGDTESIKGNNIFIPIPQSVWTKNNKILITPILDILSIFSLTDVILVGLDSNNKLKPIDTLCDILSYSGYKLEYYESSGSTAARLIPFYRFNTEGKHSVKIELATDTVPSLMFDGSCLTDIRCDGLINNLGSLSLWAEKLKSIDLPHVQYYNYSGFFSETITRIEVSEDCKALDSTVWIDIPSLKELVFHCNNAFIWVGTLDGADAKCYLNTIVFNNEESVFTDYDGISGNMTPDSLSQVFPTKILEETGTAYMPNNTNYTSYKEYFESVGWTVLPLSEWNG